MQVSGYLAHKFKYKSVDLPNISTSILQVSEYTPCPQIKHKSVDVELIHKYKSVDIQLFHKYSISQWIYNLSTSSRYTTYPQVHVKHKSMNTCLQLTH